MTHTRPLFPPNAFRFKMGGGGGSAPAGPIPAPAAPPASTSDIAVRQQKDDARKAAAKKQGINSTILSGEPEPAPAAGSPAKNVVLGGG